jgi:alginate O-acetyltransferase complex protein AlgI
MLLGGLWHGASWTFVVWGFLHGLFLVIEKLLKTFVPDRPFWHGMLGKCFFWFVTFMGVCFAWVFFRAQSFEKAWSMCGSMLGITGDFDLDFMKYKKIYIIAAITLMLHIYLRDKSLEYLGKKVPVFIQAIVIAVMLFLTILCINGEGHAFIYFQF